MSYLFTIENQIVRPNIETLLVSPFKEIWERDTDSHKAMAIKEFTVIEFMSSVKKTNPYRGYDTEERKRRLKKDIMQDENYVPDDLVLAGIEYLIDHQRNGSASYNYYMSARKAAEKLRKFFDTFEMTTVNLKTGLPIYKPKEITTSLIDTAKVIENLSALEEKVNNEIYETAKNKGQKTISVFANPETL